MARIGVALIVGGLNDLSVRVGEALVKDLSDWIDPGLERINNGLRNC